LVFLENGLIVAFFVATTAVAAASLWRTRTRIGRLPLGGVTVYLGVILVLCKTMSAGVYGMIGILLVRLASPRLQLRVACVLAALSMAYPALRVMDLFPTNSMVENTRILSTDRADSLWLRFTQEDQLLAHALERPWFGWGRWGRSRVYNGYLGGDTSITDGFWIQTLGVYGVIGFAATFGLMGLPVFRAAKALKLAQSLRDGEHLAALALILGFVMIDQLPNASISNWTWLLVGALLGRAEALQAAIRQHNPVGNFQVSSVEVLDRIGRNV